MHERRLAALLITHLPNVRYLCGFTGSAGVLAVRSTGSPVLFTDGRYTQQAEEEVKAAKVVIVKSAALAAAADWLVKKRKVETIGIEAEHLSVAARAHLTQSAVGTKLKSTSGFVEELRMVKEPPEIDQIRAAVKLASTVFDAVLPDIKPGVTERRIAAEIEYMCRRLGAEGMAFDTLVASGARSALPHGRASEAKLPTGGFVVIDFGVILGGYCSDMSRTVHLGKPDTRSRMMYEAVLGAQEAGIKAVKPGALPEEVDYTARKMLVNDGLGKYFTHSTGHGVGLEIHEPPSLRKGNQSSKQSRRKSPKGTLKTGMVITIEPGAYIPGRGGVRIEDMVVVTDRGCEVLTPTRKDLIVI